MLKLITAIKEHTTFGYVFATYYTERRNKHFIEITENVSLMHAEDQSNNFNDYEKAIIKTIDSYSDQNLTKIFGEKLKTHEFLKTVSEDDIQKRIRPFIEKRLYSVIEKLKEHEIDLYFKKDKFNTLHNDDLISLFKEPASVVFNIEKDEDGTKYYLSIKHNDLKIILNGKEGLILTNEPCSLLLDNNLYLFKDIDGKKLLPFFKKTHILIPKSSEKKWFETFAGNAIQKYEVNAVGFTVKEKIFPAKAKLVLEKDWKGEYVFVLYFQYGDVTYNANKKVEHKLDFDDANFIFVKSIRNEDWEIQIIKQLTEIGMIVQLDNNFKITDEGNKKEVQRHETITWLSENLKKITDIGIQFKQDFHQREYFTQKITSDIKIKQTKDWFDIYGTVKFGEFEIPFIQLKNNILRENREFILPDKTIALIPEEWFAKYSDLFLFGEENTDNLLVKKTHFDALEKSEIKGINSEFKENIKKLIKFNNFEVELPKKINADLRPYQKEGFKWLYFLQQNNFGGCLADDMGLGKTVQTITLLQKTIEERTPDQKNPIEKKPDQTQLNLFGQSEREVEFKKMPSLIVMPVSLIHNWKNEINRFAPELKVIKYRGNKRQEKINKFDHYDVILAGYATVRNDIELLKEIEFLYVILDESQFIKNSSSKTYQAVLELKSEYKLVLTGTPIENSLSDLWSQMNFINNGMLGDKNFFTGIFQKPIEKGHDELPELKLKKIISPFILRRTKGEVASDLPALTEQIIFCGLEDEQRSLYETEKSKIRNKFIEMIETGERKSISVEVLRALNKLRQISNHPVMIDDTYTGESGKYNEILRSIESLTSEDHKVLIFSSFVKHLNLFAKYFDNENIKYSILTGKTRNREEVISGFQSDIENKIFLISIKAGGTGLNLTEADYVFIIDPWWNPAVERQAVNRAHRIGQDKKVMVYRYISENTIEEKIIKLQEKKTQLAETFINSNNPLGDFSNDMIMNLFE